MALATILAYNTIYTYLSLVQAEREVFISLEDVSEPPVNHSLVLLIALSLQSIPFCFQLTNWLLMTLNLISELLDSG